MKFQILIIFLSFGIQLTLTEGDESVQDKFRIQGKVFPPDFHDGNWLTTSRVLVNGGEFLGFLRENGSFVINGVPSGSYVIEVSNPNFFYEPIRVDINSKGKFRARRVNYIQPSQVVQLPYPLKMKPHMQYHYFQIREQWRWSDFLMNPMVLMMVLPLLLIMILPKMMNDPETKKDMEQLNMPRYDMPDMSEMLTSFFGGQEKQKNKSVKERKKRQ